MYNEKMIICKWNILHLSAPNLNIHIHSKPFSFVVPIMTWCCASLNVVSSANPPAMMESLVHLQPALSQAVPPQRADSRAKILDQTCYLTVIKMINTVVVNRS